MPCVAKRRHQAKGESRVWGAVLTRVLKRPLAVGGARRRPARRALPSPRSGMQFKDPGFDGYSRSQPVIQTYDRLQAAFPGGAVPAMTVIKAKDVTAAPVQAAIQQLHDQALATGQLSEPSHRRDQPRQDRRRRRPLGQGQRHRRRLRALARGRCAPRSSRPRSAGWPAPRSP